MGDTLDLAAISKGIPVRLSTFTTNPVSVDYTIDSGERAARQPAPCTSPRARRSSSSLPAGDDLCEIHVTLSNPVNAELTGPQTVTLPEDCRTAEPLIREGDRWRYFKGTQEPPAGLEFARVRRQPVALGPTPIGFEASSGYESRIATNLTDMHNKYVSVYARREFTIEDPSA